ncbi:hypothetical protein [Pontibacter sp. G13]|uniref:hypothetical protein n=1 Tax=Pontibacter sp. G13 TaxID=3074898 RepID=UPI002889BDC5|nr:hypothetical protein [Pontibacter sp. G13]WNJ18476.1 hypothetical protein RJD25_26775 [Pontibacter sp. G13]
MKRLFLLVLGINLVHLQAQELIWHHTLQGEGAPITINMSDLPPPPPIPSDGLTVHAPWFFDSNMLQVHPFMTRILGTHLWFNLPKEQEVSPFFRGTTDGFGEEFRFFDRTGQSFKATKREILTKLEGMNVEEWRIRDSILLDTVNIWAAEVYLGESGGIDIHIFGHDTHSAAVMHHFPVSLERSRHRFIGGDISKVYLNPYFPIPQGEEIGYRFPSEEHSWELAETQDQTHVWQHSKESAKIIARQSPPDFNLLVKPKEAEEEIRRNHEILKTLQFAPMETTTYEAPGNGTRSWKVIETVIQDLQPGSHRWVISRVMASTEATLHFIIILPEDNLAFWESQRSLWDGLKWAPENP